MSDWPRLEVPTDEERIVRFAPAFHRCNDPKGNFGIGGVRMWWFLKIGDDAVGWEVFTDWGLPNEAFHAADPNCTHSRHLDGYPHMHGGADGGAVDFHWSTPQWDDHEPRHDCTVIGGGRACYPDVGFILGSEMFDLLRIEGDEAVWARLRSMLVSERVTS